MFKKFIEWWKPPVRRIPDRRVSISVFHERKPVNFWDHINPAKDHYTPPDEPKMSDADINWLKKELG